MMTNITKNILSGVVELSLFYKEVVVSSCPFLIRYRNDDVAKNLSQVSYKANDAVRNILNCMGYYYGQNMRKDSLWECLISQVRYGSSNGKEYEQIYAMQIPIKDLANLCGTDDICVMEVILNELRQTKVSRLNGHKAFDFYPIWGYRLDGKTRSFLLYPSAAAYSFLSNQECVSLPMTLSDSDPKPVGEKEGGGDSIKGKGGRPKTDLKEFIKLVLKHSKDTDEFDLRIHDLKKALDCKDRYAKTTDFIKKKLEPICSVGLEGSIEVIGKVPEGIRFKMVDRKKLKEIKKRYEIF